MKCAVHQDHDAIAFCQSCGNGLCSNCRISIAGVSYCQPCLDAGRIRTLGLHPEDPEERLPIPIGPVTSNSRRNFLLGIGGMIIVAIFIHLLWIYPVFGTYVQPDAPASLRIMPRTVGFAIIAVGITLCGFAFDEFKNYFNFRWGFIVGIYTILSPWMMVIGDLLLYTELVYVQDPMNSWRLLPGPLGPLYFVISTVGTVLIGVLLILWAATLLSVRKFTGSSKLNLSASILLLICAHFILLLIPMQIPMFLYIYYPHGAYLFGGLFTAYQAFLIEPATILIAIIFYRLRTSIKVQ